jgi:hypothetical protein
MPRKSLFKKKNKIKKQETEHQPDEPQQLIRSTETITSINKDLYNEINSFGNTLSNDGITMDLNAEDYSYGNINLEQVEFKKNKVEKSKPKRRRRNKKTITRVNEFTDLLQKIIDFEESTFVEKFQEKINELDISQNIKDFVKLAIEKIKDGEIVYDFILDEAEKIILNISEFTIKIKPIIDNLIEQANKIKEEPKDDIMSKLLALQQSREILIVPEENKVEENKEQKSVEKIDIMERLKALESERKLDLEPIQTEVKTIISEPISIPRSKKEKLIMNNKSYTFKINTTNEPERITKISIFGAETNTEFYRFSYDKHSCYVTASKFVKGRETPVKIHKVHNKEFQIKFTNGILQCPFVIDKSQGRFRRGAGQKEILGKITWDMNSVIVI